MSHRVLTELDVTDHSSSYFRGLECSTLSPLELTYTGLDYGIIESYTQCFPRSNWREYGQDSILHVTGKLERRSVHLMHYEISFDHDFLQTLGYPYAKHWKVGKLHSDEKRYWREYDRDEDLCRKYRFLRERVHTVRQLIPISYIDTNLTGCCIRFSSPPN